MKKLALIFGLALVTLSLSACDMIPTDLLEKTQEDICAEDPDNEICDLDVPTNLDPEVAKGLEMFIDDFNNPEITNEELCTIWLDGEDNDCDGLGDERDNVMGEVITLTGNVSNISELTEGMVTAELKFDFNGHVTVLKISLTVTDTGEGATFGISSLSILLRGIEKSDIKRGFQLFLDDYANPDLTDERVCETWYDGVDEDCDGFVMARSKFKAGSDLSKKVNIVDPDSDDDGLLMATVEYEFRGHVTVLKIAFDVTGEGENLEVMIHEIMEEPFEDAELEALVHKFATDFINEGINDEDLCTMWFDSRDQDCDGVAMTRTKFKAGSALSEKVNIMFVDTDDEGDTVPTAMVEYEFRGHVTVLKIAFNPDDTGEEMAITIDKLSVEYDGVSEEEVMRLLNEYVMDLLNPAKTDKDIEDMWTQTTDDRDDFVGKVRIKLAASACAEATVSVSTQGFNEEGMLDATANLDCDGHVTVLKISVVPGMEDGKATVMIDHTEVEETMLTEAEMEMKLLDFINDFLNSEITDEVVCEMWFNGEDNDCDGLATARAKFKAGKALADTVKITPPNPDTGEETYNVSVSIQLEEQTIQINVVFFYVGYGDILIDGVPLEFD